MILCKLCPKLRGLLSLASNTLRRLSQEIKDYIKLVQDEVTETREALKGSKCNTNAYDTDPADEFAH